MATPGCAAKAIPTLTGAEPAQAAPPVAPTLPPVETVGPFAAFARHAASEARAPTPESGRLSVLIDTRSLLLGPRRLTCGDRPVAVAIDLDPGKATFDPDDPPAPASGLAAALGEVRASGVTVFWSSALPVERADKVYTVLRATGLDEDGTDRMLLVRKGDVSKQARRAAAARDWCFVALAGDAPGDFEEALDYLREPDGPIAQALAPLYGAGWFRTPTPIA